MVKNRLKPIQMLIFFVLFCGIGFLYGDHEERRCFGWEVHGGICSTRVDTINTICEEEKAYVAARSLTVDRALEAFLEKPVASGHKHVPRLAFACSGGGYRSMIASLGFLMGLEEIGLSDAITYGATISGSSWMYANWLLRRCIQNLTLSQFGDLLQKRIEQGLFDPAVFNYERFLDKLVHVLTERGRVEWADLWGVLLTERLFGDVESAHDITFSLLRSAFSQNNSVLNELINQPFPLFALVLSDVFPYEWLEVNPYVTGSDYLKAYIPTRTFDSVFKKGRCDEIFPERSLEWFLAMFGSAYNFSFGDALLFFAKEKGPSWFLEMVQQMVETFNSHEERVFASPISNFVWQMHGHPLADRQDTEISDAGMDFNLPFPLLLIKGRDADVIFVCDASLGATIEKCLDLRLAKEYARRKGFKFPSLDNPIKVSEHVAIFRDEYDKTVPMIIYCVNPTDASTFQSVYSHDEFYTMLHAMKDEVVESKPAIAEAILKKMEA